MDILRFDIDRTFSILELVGTLAAIWPPPANSEKRSLILREVFLVVSMIITVATLLPTSAYVYYFSFDEHDIGNLMSALSETNIQFDVLLNFILFRIKQKDLQNVMEQIKSFIQSTNDREKDVLQKRIDRYIGFFLLMASSMILSGIAFACGPLFMPIDVPIQTVYPFSTDPIFTKVIIYCLHICTILQCILCFSVDFLIAMLFWFSAARFDMLALDMDDAQNEYGTKMCIRKHQELIRFIEAVENSVGIVILKTSIMIALISGCGAFPLVYKQSFIVTCQFLGMVVAGCQKMFVIAWPAEDLHGTSMVLASTVYNVKWLGRRKELTPYILVVMQRSQKPLTIRCGALLPPLNLEYFANFVKMIGSYFMAVRTIIDNS